MPQTQVVAELRNELKEYLHRQGYKVTEQAVLLGKSGIKHTFDMLAEKNDGFATHTVCIGIAAGGDKEAEASAIFSLANKAFDFTLPRRLPRTDFFCALGAAMRWALNIDISMFTALDSKVNAA